MGYGQSLVPVDGMHGDAVYGTYQGGPGLEYPGFGYFRLFLNFQVYFCGGSWGDEQVVNIRTSTGVVEPALGVEVDLVLTVVLLRNGGLQPKIGYHVVFLT